MFLKIFKYDNRSLRKGVLPLCGASMLASCVFGLMTWLMIRYSGVLYEMNGFIATLFNLGAGLLSFLMMIIMMAAIYGAYIMIGVRYYKNFISDEGYLTFTLPVSTGRLLGSKFLSGFLWLLLSGIVTLVDFIFVFAWYLPSILAESNTTFQQFIAGTGRMIGMFFNSGERIFGLFAVLLLVLSLVAANLSILYLALTLGGVMAKQHKLLAGIGLYMVLNFFIGFILEFIVLFSVAFGAIVWSNIIGGSFVILGCAAMMCIVALILLVINRYLLKNKLNLQ